MRVSVPTILLALGLLSSCGSDTLDPGDEAPVSPPASQGSAPRLVLPQNARPTPQLPTQAQQDQSLFRVPAVTNELPDEKALLSRPVSTLPSDPVNLSNQ